MVVFTDGTAEHQNVEVEGEDAVDVEDGCLHIIDENNRVLGYSLCNVKSFSIDWVVADKPSGAV